MRTRQAFGGFFRVLALVCVLIALVWFGVNRLGGVGSDTSAGPAVAADATEAGEAAEPGDASEPSVSPPAVVGAESLVVPDDARRAEVQWVHDGDSFDVRFVNPDHGDGDRDEVRLQGIDTPEPGACFSDEARDALIDLLKGRQVMVHADWDGGRFEDGRDQYFRLIADVWLDGQLVNVDQVAKGFAVARSSGGAFDDAISKAQQNARDNAVGLWAPEACGGSTVVDQAGAVLVVIREVNADAPGRDDENANGEWIDLANSSTEPIDLTGWKLRDESTRNRYEFPHNFTLAPGETVRVRSGCGTDTQAELYWCAETPVWTNAGDTAYVVQPDGRFHDVFSYGS